MPYHTERTTTHMADQVQENMQKERAKAKESPKEHTTMNQRNSKRTWHLLLLLWKTRSHERCVSVEMTNIQHRPTYSYHVSTKRQYQSDKTTRTTMPYIISGNNITVNVSTKT
eukprot:5997672-Amphidinium_carterae.1